MRVIAGQLRGRQFKSPPGRRSHPMSEKMRGALFNALGDLSGLSVLDAYAGSGALAFEAASRGATPVVAVEKSVLAYRMIKKNINELGLEDVVKVSRANISSWADTYELQTFDVIVADPPYDDLRVNILEKLVAHLNTDGIFALSWPGSEQAEQLQGLHIVKELAYGDSKLIFYKPGKALAKQSKTG